MYEDTKFINNLTVGSLSTFVDHWLVFKSHNGTWNIETLYAIKWLQIKNVIFGRGFSGSRENIVYKMFLIEWTEFVSTHDFSRHGAGSECKLIHLLLCL